MSRPARTVIERPSIESSQKSGPQRSSPVTTQPRADGDRAQILLCRAGAHKVAVALADIIEVVPMAQLRALPHAQSWVMGTLNLRGQPLIVIDLALRLNGETVPLDKTDLIIVCNTPDGAGGARVSDAVDLVQATISPLRAGIASSEAVRIVSGMVVDGAEQIPVIDVHKALGAAVDTQGAV
ncbi:MAG: chemotaxis protein CheW [Gammaproteobacteria bacterium]|nr:chemotaxis protein CheW [Gammaproteobacteria bacterium]